MNAYEGSNTMTQNTSDLPGLDHFKKDCEKIALILLGIIDRVASGTLKLREGYSQVCQTITHIDEYVGNSEEKKVLCVPLYAFCFEVRDYLTKKMS